jgi:hypothetical protein
MDERLRNLAQQCAIFKDRVYQFVDAHKRNRKTLSHHMQLVELLEVPQLVDACARNGFHDEALELASFVNGLERRHLLAAEVRLSTTSSNSSNINTRDSSSNSDNHNGLMSARSGSGVVQSIVDDVHSTLVQLRMQLLINLSENISLPKQMTVLATLRKLDNIFIDRQLALERADSAVLANLSTDKQREQALRKQFHQLAESKLQMDFLEARTVWLKKGSDHSPFGSLANNTNASNNPDATTAATTTVTNSSAGDDPTNINGDQQQQQQQQRADLGPYGQAIELLEVNRTSWYTIVIQYKSLFPETTEDSNDSTMDHEITSTSILGAWINKQVFALIHELHTLLPQIDSMTSLRTVLEQALFFATRMSEVGCDFTALLVQCFKEVLCVRAEKELVLAVSHFKNMIANEKITIEVDDVLREQVRNACHVGCIMCEVFADLSVKWSYVYVCVCVCVSLCVTLCPCVFVIVFTENLCRVHVFTHSKCPST